MHIFKSLLTAFLLMTLQATALPSGSEVVREVFTQTSLFTPFKGTTPFTQPIILFNKTLISSPSGSNLSEYIVQFKNDSFSREVVYVHEETTPVDGVFAYVIVGATVITSNLNALGFFDQLAALPTAPAQPNFDIFNLQAFLYAPQSFNTPQQIVYKDINNEYLVIGGDIFIVGLGPDNSLFSVNASTQNLFAGFMAFPSLLGQAWQDYENDFYSRALQTGWFLDGSSKAPHKTFALFDPNCIFCDKFHKQATPYIQSGKLAIRWIPVNFLRHNGKGKINSILNAKNPVKALNFNYNHFKKKKEEGGIRPSRPFTFTATAKFITGEKLFLHSPQATPTLVYRDHSGVEQISVGVPSGKKEFKELIESMNSD